MKKIFYIANTRMPNEKAHGIQVAKMVEALIECGAEVELIVPDRVTESAGSVKEFYSLRTEVKLTKLPVIDAYRKGRFAFLLSSLTFMMSSFIYMLSKSLRGESGVIYTIDMDSFSSVFLPFLGMPLFSEFHDAKKPGALYGFLFKHLDGSFVVNGLIKESLIKTFGIPAEKILVEPNAVDMKQFDISTPAAEARKALSLPQDKKIVLYSGKFYDWKGLDILVKCAAALPDNYAVYFVGGDEQRLREVTGISELPSSLVCAGERPFTEMPLWQKAADVLVLLGTKKNEYSARYTSPMKIFEYFASGVPIVASRTEAVTQVASDSNTLLYEPDDMEDLKKKIIDAAENPEAMNGRVINALQEAHKRSWNSRAQRIMGYMESK